MSVVDAPAIAAEAGRRISAADLVVGGADADLALIGEEAGEVVVLLQAAVSVDRTQAAVGSNCPNALLRKRATLSS